MSQIREALTDEDMRAALRIVDGGLQVAPESKAAKCLPELFPSGRALPKWEPQAGGHCLPAPDDIQQFLKEVQKQIKYAAPRKAAGPGNSVAEFWTFTGKADKQLWDPIGDVFLRIAVGNLPKAALKAWASSRIVALDRDEADKVRPLAIGAFLRKCVNKARPE